ncbi:hypothetical protein HEQ63_07480 [Haematospirillum jordaniae]|uniref:hypothetical protein n=1 Tax=Haematospirillum jordaniae TaxID=1549855 RepID=UPI001432F8D0|nr:hypothetical protein [Haematospirillum jordaniae]NKD86021.1 hypothetical protein [Haematospirillum jordaniae]
MSNHNTEQPFYAHGRCVHRSTFCQYDTDGRLLAMTFGNPVCTLSAHENEAVVQTIAAALKRLTATGTMTPQSTLNNNNGDIKQ